ncbi:MAG TPA: hypothetical protein PLS93_14250, partial [Accumulibacter sp.]|nr:hypothetical protein [Accumulibacter sp.]
MLQLAPGSVVDNVAPYISNPSFAELAAGAQRATPGQVVHQGLITFLGELGESRSLLAKVCRLGDHLAMIAEHDVPAAAEIVSRINDQILATRRVDVAAPDLTAPTPEWIDDAPVRPDVERAVRRMASRREAKSAIATLHRYVTQDEYVLETAVATAHPP